MNDLKKTPLNAIHRGWGRAWWISVAGTCRCNTPASSPSTVRSGAVGLFDVSHMGEIEIRGPQALDTGRLRRHQRRRQAHAGQAHYSGLLYEHGGFVDDILVHKVADDHYFLCVNAANQEKDFEHIRRREPLATPRWMSRANVTSSSPSRVPAALATVQKLTSDGSLPAIRYYHFVDGEVAGTPARIARTGYTGEDGFEITSTPGEAERGLGRHFSTAGEEFGIQPCGLGARNTLRLEAGMALYGHEIDASINPWEADLGWIVKMDKGDFLGREALAQAQGARRAEADRVRNAGRGIGRDGYEVQVDGVRRGVGDQRRTLANARQEYRHVLLCPRRRRRLGRRIEMISSNQTGGGGHRGHAFL